MCAREKDVSWIFSLKGEVPQFLRKLKGERNKGFYRYSMTGDVYNEDMKWGLGNATFMIKILYTLGILKHWKKECDEMVDFIQSFQQEDGSFFDPVVKKDARMSDMVGALKMRNFSNFFHQQTIRAETRQTFSSLKLLGVKPRWEYQNFPQSVEGVDRYLKKLNWNFPWAAGSHVSHLLFFIQNSELENKDELIDRVCEFLKKIYRPQSGSWYMGVPSTQEKINGAMKIITGLKVIDRVKFDHAEALIDLALSATNDRQACDNFNIVYVLKYANEVMGSTYRYGEICEFMRKRLKLYRKHYYPEHGGFSFYSHRANERYYGARISRGLNEPDIHGTTLFLWGIALIAQVLGCEEELEFNEFIT